MKNCPECERVRRAFAEATRLNMEIGFLQIDAREDSKEKKEVLKAAAIAADKRWHVVKAELEEHRAMHGEDSAVRSAEGK